MDPSLLFYVGGTVVSAAFAAGGAYLAVKVKLEYLERGVLENRKDIKDLRDATKEDIDRVHSRLNRVNERARLNGQ